MALPAHTVSAQHQLAKAAAPVSNRGCSSSHFWPSIISGAIQAKVPTEPAGSSDRYVPRWMCAAPTSAGGWASRHAGDATGGCTTQPKHTPCRRCRGQHTCRSHGPGVAGIPTCQLSGTAAGQQDVGALDVQVRHTLQKAVQQQQQQPRNELAGCDLLSASSQAALSKNRSRSRSSGSSSRGPPWHAGRSGPARGRKPRSFPDRTCSSGQQGKGAGRPSQVPPWLASHAPPAAWHAQCSGRESVGAACMRSTPSAHQPNRRSLVPCLRICSAECKSRPAAYSCRPGREVG